jgi:hypothetical protein
MLQVEGKLSEIGHFLGSGLPIPGNFALPRLLDGRITLTVILWIDARDTSLALVPIFASGPAECRVFFTLTG